MRNASRDSWQSSCHLKGTTPPSWRTTDNWLASMSLLSFLRDYGKLFNVAYMLQKDTIKKRLDSGLSYTEFSYTMLQAMDFLHLYEAYNCRLQIGGSDQWGNLTSGMELIRKVKGDEAEVWGITSPLITKSDGSKFGKSEGKNIWLDPSKTSAYEFYQFWLNIPDADIVDYLKRLSLHTPEEIEALAKCVQEAPEKREAQAALADELTEIVHGSEGLAKANRITETFFHGDIMTLTPDEMKEGLADAAKSHVDDGTPILDALIAAGIASSKGDARRLVQQGSITVNGSKVTDIAAVLKQSEAVNQEFTILKKGKKNYYIITF
jgi:tyrosyl-tRNA synthetase